MHYNAACRPARRVCGSRSLRLYDAIEVNTGLICFVRINSSLATDAETLSQETAKFNLPYFQYDRNNPPVALVLSRFVDNNGANFRFFRDLQLLY